eukprot:2003873-Pleurochrysis_carterae.AAC.3
MPIQRRDLDGRPRLQAYSLPARPHREAPDAQYLCPAHAHHGARWAAFKRTVMEIRADVGEHGLDAVVLIAELDVDAAMNAPVSQEDTAVALIKRMKHAYEVPQRLHDP